jgi:Ca2+-binding RTX toxin-like protein
LRSIATAVAAAVVIVAAGASAGASGSTDGAPEQAATSRSWVADWPPASTWMDRLNFYRSQAGLPGVTSVADWSEGNRLHAIYVIENQVLAHSEDPGNPWYTPEGDEAARNNNLYWSSGNDGEVAAVDYWMSNTFHGVALIDPRLSRSGYGDYYDASASGYRFAAGLDVLRGRDSTTDPGYPVEYPGNGTVTPLYAYEGGESPDSLASCPGYQAPTGAPIFLLLGNGSTTPSVTASSLTEDGASIPHCRFDESTYSNSSASLQSLGRALLDSRDAVVILPKEPLQPGATYDVSVTVNGVTHQWSFSAYDDGAATPTCDGKTATIVGNAGDNVLRGTAGNDVIWAGAGNDEVNALGGDDTVCLGDGDDWARGGLGDDVILGEDGDDIIFGIGDENTLYGGLGNDTIWGSAEADELYGGGGTDTIYGNGGADTVYGGPGADLVKGGSWGDFVYGETGDDVLFGGAGDDYLDGGAGTDELRGGLGNDTCVAGEVLNAC